MMPGQKISYIDLSVFQRDVSSISEETESTRHSLGYLDFLDSEIRWHVIRFGTANEESANFHLYTYSIRGLFRFLRTARRLNPDVILFHSYRFPIRFLILRIMFPHTKIAVQHHACTPSRNAVKRFLQRFAYPKTDAHVFTDTALSVPLSMGEILGRAPIFEVVACSTDFKPEDKHTARQSLGLPPDKKVVIWVGHLNENKDPMCLMKAVEVLSRTRNDFTVQMFYGSGKLRPEIENFIRESNLSPLFSLNGRIANDKLEQWYNAADIFVSCSHSESSGIALAESMACGCFPVVSDIPSFRKITNGAGARLFPPGDHRKLAEALALALDADLQKAQTLSRKAFDRNASFQAIARGISDMVRSLNQKSS